MALAYIYTRVSTPEQNSNVDNNSIATQVNIATTFANNQGMEIAGITSEVCSARSVKNQKELLKLFNTIKNNHKEQPVNILVLDVSRFTRDLIGIGRFFDDFKKYHLSIIAITDNVIYKTNINDNENTRFIEKLLDAKKESDKISQRCKISYQIRKAKGYRIHVPYGKTRVFKKNKYSYLNNKPEIKNINLIIRLRDRNMLSIKQIEQYLNSNNITHRNGKPFTYSRVKTIIHQHSADALTKQMQFM
jgi:DNA invertase Pin-like site-specific DNA recombinase